MADTWTVTRNQIPWEAASSRGPVLPLGRIVYHDSRNRAYPWRRRADRKLTSQLWTRHGGILDQGSLGSCTGNEEVGALECDPCFAALPPAHPALDETLAVVIYSAAEKIDGGAGYPPEDEGSSGPSAAKAAKNLGLISGYLHCFSLADVLDALEEHPVGVGSNWYDSMDSPDSSGLVTISPGADIRGGHEYLARGKDVDRKLVFFDNSWGTGWGQAGSFSYSWDTLERLLHEQGDGTISLPLTVTPPDPVPVPPPQPPADYASLALFRQTQAWAEGRRHVGPARVIAADLRAWYSAKGFR